MVYVLDKNNNPLMPTENHAKIRILLKTGKASVVRRMPFTIRLLYNSTDYTQDINLGVDAGSKHIGLSATTVTKVLFEADILLRNDISELLSTRRENRSARRSRKTRHRKARFNNRRRGEGWLAPSIKGKADCHLNAVRKVQTILPITSITVETASFDIQKIKNPDISGTDYQHGDQLGFWNVREYVLWRDGHECQCCHGKSGDKILNVHHIESRKTGGNAPNNLITLCETCHKGYHKGTVKLPKAIHRGMKFKDAAFMGVMRWAVFNKLKELNSTIPVHMTYGYITKDKRIQHGLPKDHYIDARCISGHPDAKPSGNNGGDEVYYYRKIRCHNRQIHKSTIRKDGIRKRNQAEYEVKGFRLFDHVQYKGNTHCFVFGRRKTGVFSVRDINGVKVTKWGDISCNKLKLLSPQSGYITDRYIVKYKTESKVQVAPLRY